MGSFTSKDADGNLVELKIKMKTDNQEELLTCRLRLGQGTTYMATFNYDQDSEKSSDPHKLRDRKSILLTKMAKNT